MMPSEDKYLNILQQYWGYADFRGVQREIIESIGSGRDTLGLMPTGGGKSITFQVPALAQDGLCIVVTPLIALMKDQVQHLRAKGIAATAIYSDMSSREIVTALDNCIFGGVKLLYISPERIGSDIFLQKLRRTKVSFITVDEAHCISQWGYDFRPAYLRIADIRREKPDAPVLALTATATPDVVDDIQEKLGFKQKNTFRMSFERANLAYVVRTANDKRAELIHILRSVRGCAIVYVRSRKRTKEIAQLLNGSDISATFYHAGLEHNLKDERQTDWQADKIRVMVATNAFGMGIDKPDVRMVVHIDCPDSIEAYFQEAGRAGRDGRKSYAVLLCNRTDERKLEKRIADNFPEKSYIKDIYEHLAYYYEIAEGSGAWHTFTFDIGKFCAAYKYFPIQVNASLHLLARAGYLDYETDPDASARLIFLLERNDLYRLDQLTPHEDAVITALLRNYGGLFTDYVYIDEALLAQQTSLTRQQIYLILRGLTQRRILHFIPQRKMPFITYTQRREAKERIVIQPTVYEQRKEQFERRINAMINYTRNNQVCRSTQLLRYFGESGTDDCRQCDVCIDRMAMLTDEQRVAAAAEKIEQLLTEKRSLSIVEIASRLGLPARYMDRALEMLVGEEKITIDGSEISAI